MSVTAMLLDAMLELLFKSSFSVVNPSCVCGLFCLQFRSDFLFFYSIIYIFNLWTFWLWKHVLITYFTDLVAAGFYFFLLTYRFYATDSIVFCDLVSTRLILFRLAFCRILFAASLHFHTYIRVSVLLLGYKIDFAVIQP